MSICHRLVNHAGFFSEFFFMIKSYLYSKKHNKQFIIDTTNWLFKYKLGWDDYFIPIENNSEPSDIESYCFFNYVNDINNNILEEFTVIDYKNAINDIYKYNTTVQSNINDKYKELELFNKNYGSLFIRRGDKLGHESKIYYTDVYIELLLEKYPDCSIIYIQTDDYTCILEAEKYINDNSLNIKIITMCNNYMRGVFLSSKPTTNIQKNIKYLDSIQVNYKSVFEMNSHEIYDHTMDMLIGLDIVFHSKCCILDYQSNVSRFIKLKHENPNNVFDVEGYELNKNFCPAFPESVYDDYYTFRHS